MNQRQGERTRKRVDSFSQICNLFIRVGLFFLVVFSPLALGTVQPWAYTTMEIVILFLLAAWFSKMIWRGQFKISKLPVFFPLSIFIVIVIFQMVPLPPKLLSTLSPASHKAYKVIGPERVADRTPPEGMQTQWRPISVYVHQTKSGLLKFLAYMAVFFLVVNNLNSRRDVRFFLWTLAVSGFLFSLFALAQKFTWDGMIFWYFRPPPGMSVFGSYLNKNHFAGYIEMIIPLTIGLGLSGLSSRVFPSVSIQDQNLSEGRIESNPGRLYVLLFMSVLMGVALFLSLSRGGMISFLVSMFMMVFLLRKKGRDGSWSKPLYIAITLMLFLIATIGHDQVGGRIATLFHVDGLNREIVRPRLWMEALRVLSEFPAFGVGLAAFGSVFFLYQAPGTRGVVDLYAHNDYLQLLSETGLVGGVLIFSAALLFFFHILSRFRALRDRRMIPMVAGGIASCVAIAVHSFVDFNLYIPANALLLALILGLLVVTVNLRGGETSQRFTLPFVTFSFVKNRRFLCGVVFVLTPLLALILIWANRVEDRIQFRFGEKYRHRMMINAEENPKQAIRHGEKAFDAFRTAISMNPLKARYHFQIGKTAHKIYALRALVKTIPPRKIGRNEKSFQTALRLKPWDEKLHFDVAVYFFRNWDSFLPSERSIGKNAFRKAVKLDPSLISEAKWKFRREKNCRNKELFEFLNGFSLK